LPGQQLVQDDADGVDVGAGVDAVPLAARLLGTHVRRRAGEARPGAEVLLAQGQTEVGHDGAAVSVQQDVGRLDVAVDEAMPMGMVQAFRHPGDDLDGLRGGQPPLLQPCLQVGALDELPHDVAEAVVGAAEVVHGKDGGVVEGGQHARLGQVRLGVGGGGDALAPRHLDSDVAAQVVVVAAVDDAEGARAQPGRHPVAPQALRRPLLPGRGGMRPGVAALGDGLVVAGGVGVGRTGGRQGRVGHRALSATGTAWINGCGNCSGPPPGAQAAGPGRCFSRGGGLAAGVLPGGGARHYNPQDGGPAGRLARRRHGARAAVPRLAAPAGRGSRACRRRSPGRDTLPPPAARRPRRRRRSSRHGRSSRT
jgi:hypothetical protein